MYACWGKKCHFVAREWGRKPVQKQLIETTKWHTHDGWGIRWCAAQPSAALGWLVGCEAALTATSQPLRAPHHMHSNLLTAPREMFPVVSPSSNHGVQSPCTHLGAQGRLRRPATREHRHTLASNGRTETEPQGRRGPHPSPRTDRLVQPPQSLGDGALSHAVGDAAHVVLRAHGRGVIIRAPPSEWPSPGARNRPPLRLPSLARLTPAAVGVLAGGGRSAEIRHRTRGHHRAVRRVLGALAPTV
jgi:hypothetical protein